MQNQQQGQGQQMQYVAVPVSTFNPSVQPTYMVPVQQLSVAVKQIRILSILQMIIGSLSLLLGILVIPLTFTWASIIGFAIWSGIWILVTGGLGLGSSKNPTNGCLNGTHMAFNIVSCLLAFMDFVVYSIIMAQYGYRAGYCGGYYYYSGSSCHKSRTIIGLFSILLICMLAEFIIALTASIYCCKAACNSCCYPSAAGVQQVMIQQPSGQHHMMIQTTGHMPSATYVPTYHSSSGFSQPQVILTTAPGYTQATAQPNVTYTQGMSPTSNAAQSQTDAKPDFEGPPPAYS